MSSYPVRPPKVGKLRPTQVVTQQGPGAVIDLPELSVVVAGIDEWQTRGTDRIAEPRLEAFLRAAGLFRPSPGDGALAGVPAYVFPEWLVCPNVRCRMLAPKESFHWVEPPAGEFRCPRVHRHRGQNQVPAFPARFMIACPQGHLDDFPWDNWAHDGPGGSCTRSLRLDDMGWSGSVNDLVVRCEGCDARRPMGGVFERDAIKDCSRRRPWLGPSDHEADCEEKPRVILRGASNAYFPVVASALSIPPYSDPIQLAIAPFLDRLKELDTVDAIKEVARFNLLGDLLTRYTPDELLLAARGEVTKTERLRPDEYRAFLDPPDPAQPPTSSKYDMSAYPPGLRPVCSRRWERPRVYARCAPYAVSPGLSQALTSATLRTLPNSTLTWLPSDQQTRGGDPRSSYEERAFSYPWRNGRSRIGSARSLLSPEPRNCPPNSRSTKPTARTAESRAILRPACVMYCCIPSRMPSSGGSASTRVTPRRPYARGSTAHPGLSQWRDCLSTQPVPTPKAPWEGS